MKGEIKEVLLFREVRSNRKGLLSFIKWSVEVSQNTLQLRTKGGKGAVYTHMMYRG